MGIEASSGPPGYPNGAPMTSTSSGSSGLGFGGLLSGFGAGMSAVSAYSTAKNQQAALNAQAQTEANNATLDEWQAEDATTRGQTAASVAELKGGQIHGAQRAALAANGVALEGGSAQNVLNSADFMNAVDVSTIQANAAREAWGYTMAARGATQRSAAARSAASSVSPWLSAGTSLLTSATSVANRWYSAAARTTPGAGAF